MIRKIKDFVWEVPKEDDAGMKVPVRIYASKTIIEYMQRDRTLKQAMNAASLPSIVSNMLVMPDGHEGYGSPIGGVAAFDADEGIISPSFIGFDIGCGVRLIKTNITAEELKPRIGSLMDSMFKNVPSGVGSKMNLGFSAGEVDKIAEGGVGYLVEKGYGFSDDFKSIEEGKRMEGAEPGNVSAMAKKRGASQLGTLGAGNHFAEVQKVESISDARIAKAFGLEKDMVVVMLHSGSRGYGHQICSDYIKVLFDYQKRNNITVPDPELGYTHIGSREADSYLGSMRAAINFAFANRQIMTHFIRKSFEETFGRSADSLGMEILYDLSHNIAKLEEHEVEGRRRKLWVHRKGATRAFGPGRKEIPERYREYGQPVLIPGSMGTASYVLAGMEQSMAETFGSSCHGAGRVMSRHQAVRDIPSSKTINEMKRKSIEIRVRSRKLISEEAEWAYKDVDEVVAAVEGADISRIVARLVPLGVTKG
jgi:tRNA-splicing ligase RtcB